MSDNPEAPKSRSVLVAAVALLRAAMLGVCLLLVDEIIPLGTSAAVLLLASSCGVALSSSLAASRLTTRGFFTGAVFAGVVVYFLIQALGILPFGVGHGSVKFLWWHAMQLHLQMIAAVFALAGISTFLFWRRAALATLELSLLVFGAVAALAGHRQFRFDSPALIGDLAWYFGVHPLTLLVSVGCFLTAGLAIYLASSGFLPHQVATSNRPTQSVRLSHRPVAAGLGVVAALAILVGISAGVFSYFRPEVERRTTNGVALNPEQGQPPLTFESAIGTNPQPAALVRLEGDYKNNPMEPRLYFRERTMSSLDGQQLVEAPEPYDRDFPLVVPGSAVEIPVDQTFESRQSLAQSIYLLADHNRAIALDAPQSFVKLRNPQPKRFREAYRVYSSVLSLSIESLRGLKVGDYRWDQKTWEHYTQKHSDPRYADLAKEITKGISDPVLQAYAIVDWLSEHTTYTLAPNHQVPDGGDNTAAYLFGDLRGFCVHFAHAMAFMFRALDIPARIGAGYLSDISQSKDGHLLLRMNDRHAWAEIYIENRGWVTMDIQPAHVESHGETPVDMNLLEELMGLVDPGEELLPDTLLDDEKNIKPPAKFELPSLRTVVEIVSAFLALLILIKLYIRCGWVFARSQEARARRSYVSVASRLVDLGIPRQWAETRTEYQARASERLRLLLEHAALRDTATSLNFAVYGPEQPHALIAATIQSIDEARRADHRALSSLPLPRRIWAGINLRSVFHRALGGGW